MFCNKCGKKIDYNSFLCNECSNGESVVGTEDLTFTLPNAPMVANEEPTNTVSPQKVGVKGAISAAIMSYVSLILNCCGFVLMWIGIISALLYAEGPPTKEDVYYDHEMLLFFAMAYGLAGLIFGIASVIPSIRGFCRSVTAINVVKKSRPKPIATLVLGIVGLDISVANLILITYNALLVIATAVSLIVVATGGF